MPGAGYDDAAHVSKIELLSPDPHSLQKHRVQQGLLTALTFILNTISQAHYSVVLERKHN